MFRLQYSFLLTVALAQIVTPVPQEWQGKSCVDDCDCTIDVSELGETIKDMTKAEIQAAQPMCFNLKECLCPPGYFYSVSTRFCVKECSAINLLETFTRYPASGIVAHNDFKFMGTATLCKSECAKHPDCQNVEVRDINGNCHGSRISGGAEVGFVTDSPEWDHFQRNCR